jgi:hypothetical protein
MKSQIHELKYKTNKILSKTTKIFSFVKIILLLSVFVTSCIPNTPGGNPTPTNTFNVNLSNQLSQADTIIVVDGDSLAFQLLTYSFFGTTTFLILSTNNPNFEILNTKEYPYNLNTNQYDSTQTPDNGVNTIDGGILINDSYTANPWLPFITSPYQSIELLPYLSVSTLDLSMSDRPSWFWYFMKKNIDQYIVLRKLEGSQYQYYWIKIRNVIIHNATTYQNYVKIFNGKYQFNSITTGQ